MRLSRRAEPFDSDQHIFELKIDGFRALAFIEDGKGELISRNGNTFRGFAELARWIAEHLRVESAVLDGEIACVDKSGRPVFRDLVVRHQHSFDSIVISQKRSCRSAQCSGQACLRFLVRTGISSAGAFN